VVVTVGSHSGLAGIAVWMNKYFKLEGERRIKKKDPIVLKLKEYIDKEYAKGRVTSFSDEELESLINFYAKRRGQGIGETPGFDSSEP